MQLHAEIGINLEIYHQTAHYIGPQSSPPSRCQQIRYSLLSADFRRFTDMPAELFGWQSYIPKLNFAMGIHFNPIKL